MKQLFLVAISLLLVQGAFAQTINVKESKVVFEVMNRGSLVTGTILNVKGEVNLDEGNLDASNFSATVAPASIDTESGKRDAHLQKDDFFGAENFPLIKMESKKITKTDEGYEATATLMIRDVSMEVTIPFTLKTEGSKQTLEGSLSVQRKDYKLGVQMDEKSIGFDVAVRVTCVVDVK